MDFLDVQALLLRGDEDMGSAQREDLLQTQLAVGWEATKEFNLVFQILL